MIQTDVGLVGGNHDYVESVDFQEFFRGSRRSAGHAGELFVKTEIVLESYGAGSAGLFLNLYPFLGLDGLMNTFAPAAARLQAAGKGINYYHLPVFNNVVLVPLKNSLRFDRGLQMMHVLDAFF